MSKLTSCAIEKCGLTFFALCRCCNKDLCMNHLKEHFDVLSTKLLPMVDELNSLLDRLQQPMPNESVHLQTLEQWRAEAHRLLDAYCDAKREHISRGLRKQYEERLGKTRTVLNQMLHQEGFTRENFDRVQADLEWNAKSIDEMEHFRCITSPLYIKDDHVTVSSHPAPKSIKPKNPKARKDRSHCVESGRVEKVATSHVPGSNLSSGLSRSTSETSSSLMHELLASAHHSPPSRSSASGKTGPFQISVQSRMADRLAFLVRPSDSVKYLKSKIYAQQSIPAGNQRLTFMDKELLDDEPLSNYDITSSATLNLFWRG